MRNWNLGGIGASKRQGSDNASYTLINCDIHGDPGVLKCHPTVETDGSSGDPPDEAIVSIVEVTEGDTDIPASYHFGIGGTVWKRTRADVWSELGTISEGTEYGAINDAKLFDGDIYYSMQRRIGKYTPNTTWASARDDDFAAIEFDLEHPLLVVQNDLYAGHTNHIGKITPSWQAATTGFLDTDDAADQEGTPNIVRIPATGHGLVAGDSIIITLTTNYNGNFVVKNVSDLDHFDIESAFETETFADTDVFTVQMPNALLFEDGYVVESLGQMSRYLIVGAHKMGAPVNSIIGFAKIFKWDLVSNTYSSEQELKDTGISAMIEYNGGLLLSVGLDGDLYSYDGNFATKFKKIPNTTAGATKIRKNAWSAWKGQTLLGVGGTKGIYSLGSFDAGYPEVLSRPITLGSAIANSDIYSISRVSGEAEGVYSESLLMSYKIGVGDYFKKLSTDLGTAETESMLMPLVDSKGRKVTPSPRVEYESYPSGTTIALYASINRGAYAALTLEKTVENVLTSRTITNAREIQYKLVLTPNGASTPIIEFYG